MEINNLETTIFASVKMELFLVLNYDSFQPVTTITIWKGQFYTMGAQDAPLNIRINFILNINVSIS